MVMRQAQGIITDHGSVSGHMAALPREFGVPTILGAEGATAAIPNGLEITVDAYSGGIYQGRVLELLKLQRLRETHMMGAPIYLTRSGAHRVPAARSGGRRTARGRPAGGLSRCGLGLFP